MVESLSTSENVLQARNNLDDINYAKPAPPPIMPYPYTEQQIERHIADLIVLAGLFPDSKAKETVQIIRQLQEPKEIDMEILAAAVHDAYCRYYVKTHNKEYWTKGDYRLLDEETKEIDRETVRAVLRQQSYTNRQLQGKT